MPSTGAVSGELQPTGRTHFGAGEETKEEAVAETAHDELNASPIPQQPALHRVRR